MKPHAWRTDEPWTLADVLSAGAYVVASAVALGGLFYGLLLTIGAAR